MHVTDVFSIDGRTFSINRDVDIQLVSFLPRVSSFGISLPAIVCQKPMFQLTIAKTKDN